MHVEKLNRRRAITILAGTAAALSFENLLAPAQANDEYEWQGLAMGTDARIIFRNAEKAALQAALVAVFDEIERLERALSLFRNDSEIVRLNHESVLRSPSLDMRRSLQLALSIADMTNGLFDPTVQALWEAHVDWFATGAATVPPEDIIRAARSTVSWQKIELAANSIRLGSGQRITLNGLGQGYVTDRVAELLRAHGFSRVLVDLGEQRALGRPQTGTAWHIARSDAVPFELSDGALATSEGAGCIFGAGDAAHHLFDPRTGRSASHWRRVTVHHSSAAVADSLSTALYAATAEEIATIVSKFRGLVVWAIGCDNMEHRWIAPPVHGVSI